MASTTIHEYGEFSVTASDKALGLNLPQQAGGLLWLPMLLMAVMAFPIAFVLSVVRANLVANGQTIQEAATAAALGQYVPAVMFLGFASVFAAIVFSIARILGTLRTGGGGVQEASGRRVLTLTMPWTAKGMIALMMMAMMALLFAVIVHVALGATVQNAVLAGDQATVEAITVWATWLEGLRRFGVAVYLGSFALGLGTIVQVLRFQSARIRELSSE